MPDRQTHQSRAVVALGGNAIVPAGARGTAGEQIASVSRAMGFVADLVAVGTQVILTHGNGPQVGNLLIKNELAREVVPAVPLDWCVAQVQATIGFVAATALERELADRGIAGPVVPTISRTLVAADDPAWAQPTKPVGPYLPAHEAKRRMVELEQIWAPQGDRGWRRLVPSPEPQEILDREAVLLLLDAGAVVVAAGGGGIPMVRDPDGRLRGVEAVVDKDLAGARLAQETGADQLIILTDVAGVALGYGTPDEQWLEDVSAERLRVLAGQGHFASGSMGPKVEAALRFVEGGGRRALIGALDDATAVAAGDAGTRVTASGDGR